MPGPHRHQQGVGRLETFRMQSGTPSESRKGEKETSNPKSLEERMSEIFVTKVTEPGCNPATRKTKAGGDMDQRRSTCLACMKAQGQSPTSPRKKLQSRGFVHLCYRMRHGMQVSSVVRTNRRIPRLNTAYTEIKRPKWERELPGSSDGVKAHSPHPT